LPNTKLNETLLTKTPIHYALSSQITNCLHLNLDNIRGQNADNAHRAHEKTQPHRQRFENRMPNNNKIGSEDGGVFQQSEIPWLTLSGRERERQSLSSKNAA